MAYNHQQVEVVIINGASLATVGDKADWSPGKIPHYVRGVAIVARTAGAETGVVKFDKQPTAGSATGRGDGDVAVLNIPNPLAQGKSLVKDNIKVLIKPGESVVAEVTDVVAGITDCDIIIVVEPSWEHIDNVAGIVKST